MVKKIGVVLVFILFFIFSYSVQAVTDLTWTNASSFKIYESSSTTWGEGTLKCDVTLTDDNGGASASCGSSLSASTQYRVEVVLKNDAITTSAAMNAGDIVYHKMFSGWAGSIPTLGSCVFNDIESDDAEVPTCGVSINGTNIEITVANGGQVNIGLGET